MNRPLHVDFKEGSSDVMQSAYLYDRAGRIETVRSHLTGSGDVVSSHRYRYDPANRRVEAKKRGQTLLKKSVVDFAYFTDGVVLGNCEFVDEFFKEKRAYFGKRRKSGARKMKGADSGELRTLRDLRIT